MSAFPLRTIRADQAQASVSPLGAHVLSWVPNGEHPVLWTSSKASPDTHPQHAGIPLCLPWFSSPELSTASLAPHATQGHGFARNTLWDVLEDDGICSRTVLGMRHQRDDHGGVFPHAFSAQLEIDLGEDLDLKLTLINDDDHVISMECALHTYLAVGDVKDVSIKGLEGSRYTDLLTGTTHKQYGPLTLVGPTDRIYHTREALIVEDPRWLREISLETVGAMSTIVWNPWAEGVTRFTDIGPSEWTDFICVESGNVREQAVHLAPGGRHRLHLSLHTDSLS
ncbi:MAG: D-hexose-6-phosphate mutarotase [Actinomycetaceae bacterium]|nr:D-hexose-6-phosphate mutarotase [Actinomycetaceae bacterium]